MGDRDLPGELRRMNPVTDIRLRAVSNGVKAVLLLSGGIDSATTLYIARSRGYKCSCLAFDYGQRHKQELRAARRIAGAAHVSLRILKISLPWQGSALLDSKQRLPKDRSPREMAQDIPATYVPARNTIFLSFALSYAEAIGAGAIFIGANALDFSGYPDCRPEFYRAFHRVIDTGTKARRIKVYTPLITKTKGEIIRWGMRLGVPYDLTYSCYEGRPKPCERCDACILRKKGFEEAGVKRVW